MSMQSKIEKHLNILGTISILEAASDYQLSGGSLTKYISNLRKQGLDIKKEFRKNTITGRRYARYFIVKG